MSKKTTIIIIVFAALIVIGAVIGFIASNKTLGKTVKIGISQLVQHPALDSACEGFLEALKEAGYEDGKNIKVDIQNAQGDVTNAQTIARKFADEEVDIILAIATPAAQAAANVTKDIPILITAVTDPVIAGLAESLDKPGSNVTGTTDMNPVYDQVKLAKDLVPDLKRLGVLYNSGEPNSIVQVEIAKEAAKDLGLTLIEATVSNSSEVNQATQSLMGRVEAIYVPTDNTIVSAIGAVIKVANEDKIPVIGSERGQVEAGAIATKGLDYRKLGKQTGEIAIKIIKGKQPKDIPIEGSKDVAFIINMNAAKILGINIEKDLLDKADEIIE